MTRKFEVVARKLAEFQTATTWSEPRDQKEKPKCQFFLVAYDELIPEPTKWPLLDRFSSWKRPEGGQFFFQVPIDFDVVSMGKKFQTMGKEMENGGKSGTNWKITKNIKEFHHLL